MRDIQDQPRSHLLCRLRIWHSWEDKEMVDRPVIEGREHIRVTNFRRCRREGCPHYSRWQMVNVDYLPFRDNPVTPVTPVT